MYGIHFLTTEEMRKVTKFMESNLGKKKKDINFKELQNLLNLSPNVGQILEKSLEKYYYYSPQNFEDILSQEEISRLKRKINVETSISLRSIILKIVNKEYQGFISIQERDEFLKKLEKMLNVPKDKIERLIWLDLEENHVLKKVRTNLTEEEKIDNLIDYYNYLSLNFLLRKADRMTIRFKTLDSNFVKTVYWQTKKMWMLCDFKSNQCLIYPPKEMLPRKYGFILSIIVRRIMKFDFDEIVLKVGRRKLVLSKEILKKCLKTKPEDEENIIFDSTVEENFAEQFGEERNHWKLIREPMPIIRDDLIFIPDFLLKRGNKEIFLEVIGFWTDEYRRKKREKLKKLRDLEIILLVNKKYETEFKDIGFPCFSYINEKTFPILSIVEFLSQYEKDEIEEKRREILLKKEKYVKEILESKKDFIGIRELSSILNCFDEQVTSLIKGITPEKFGYKFLDGIGLFSERFYEKTVSQDWTGPLNEVNKKLSELGIPSSFLEKIGYRIEWKSLNDGVVKKVE